MNKHATNPKEKEHASKDFQQYHSFRLNNKIGLYECLFCRFACANRGNKKSNPHFNTNLKAQFILGEIRLHLQEHPTELAFVCKRESLLSEIDPHSVESTVIMKLPDRADVQVVPFNVEDQTRLINWENIKKIE